MNRRDLYKKVKGITNNNDDYPFEIRIEVYKFAETSFRLYLTTVEQEIEISDIIKQEYKNDTGRSASEQVEDKRLLKAKQDLESDKRDMIRGIRSEFNKALKDKNRIQEFFDYSNQFIKTSPFVKEYSFELADFTTKLLLSRLRANDDQLAEKILLNYIENIIPFAGLSNKSMDVATNGLVLALKHQRKDIFQKIHVHILGPAFDITASHQPILLFNLAAYYAKTQDKENLLLATRQALVSGKKADEFMPDSDFRDYLTDQDFIFTLEG